MIDQKSQTNEWRTGNGADDGGEKERKRGKERGTASDLEEMELDGIKPIMMREPLQLGRGLEIRTCASIL